MTDEGRCASITHSQTHDDEDINVVLKLFAAGPRHSPEPPGMA